MRKMMQRSFAFLLLFTIYISNAQTFNWEGLDSLLHQEEARHGGHFSLSLLRCADDELLYAYRGTEMMTPASIVKVLSTGAVLNSLGGGYRFPTEISLIGKQRRSIFRGDLLIRSTGDPSIGSEYIEGEEERLAEEIVWALKKRGIKRITGRLLIDAFLAEEQGTIPSWQVEDIGFYYGAGLYGFNYKDNRFRLEVNTRRRRGRPRMKPWPKKYKFKLTNHLRIARREKVCAYPILRRKYSEVVLEGTVPRSYKAYPLILSHPNPAYYAAVEIRSYLKKQGIRFDKAPKVSYQPIDKQGEELHYYYSQPLDSLARITNYHSHNLFAEAFAALLANGESRGKAVENYWINRLKLSAKSLRLVDGSGLSRKDRVCTQTYVQALNELLSDSNPEKSHLLLSLPKVGRDGTVRKLLGEDELNAFFKSGSMSGVVSYAGYVFYRGKWYALCCICNDFDRNSQARNAIRQALRYLFPN